MGTSYSFADVSVGKVYTNLKTAMKDARKLQKVNPVNWLIINIEKKTVAGVIGVFPAWVWIGQKANHQKRSAYG